MLNDKRWCEALCMWVADIEDEGTNFIDCDQECDICDSCVELTKE